MSVNSPKSITVNLRHDLDSYVRTSSKQRNMSMNEIINKAVQYYRSKQTRRLKHERKKEKTDAGILV